MPEPTGDYDPAVGRTNPMTVPPPEQLDEPPTGDLRERLAEALYQWTLAAAAPGGTRPPYLDPRTEERLRANSRARADAVLPVVEAETAALRQRIEEVEDQRDQALAWQDTAERELRNAERRLDAAERIAAALEAERDKARAAVADEQRRADERRTELLEERDEALDALADAEKRAEQAERERDQARDAIADERRGRLAAEAAVRRVRALLDPYPEGAVFAIHRGVGSERRVQAVLPSDAILAALDAEGRPDETLAALERQRDDAIAALTTHAAEAHRRKWAHSEDNQAAFDALHRLGDEILASRDRLRAALTIKQPKETDR